MPRGPIGFLAGLIDGLQPSLPAIQAQQRRRREEAEKAELERRRKWQALMDSTWERGTPEFTGDYERSWPPGVPEVGAHGPRVVSAALAPRDGERRLARLLQEGRPRAGAGLPEAVVRPLKSERYGV